MSVLKEIADEARELMKEHSLYGWLFQWDNAATRMGACDYRNQIISLSRKLAPRAPREIVRNTILHEIAHALVGSGHGHDATWRSMARTIGCTGDRCFDASKVEPVPGKWQAACPSCSNVFHMYRRPSPRYRRYCKRCGTVRGALTYQEVR